MRQIFHDRSAPHPFQFISMLSFERLWLLDDQNLFTLKYGRYMCMYLGAYSWGHPESEVSQNHRRKVIDPHSKTVRILWSVAFIVLGICSYITAKKKKTEERSHHSIEIKTSVILRGYAVFRLRLFLIFLGVLGRMWNSFNATSTSTAKYVDVTV